MYFKNISENVRKGVNLSLKNFTQQRIIFLLKLIRLGIIIPQKDV